MEIFQDFVRLFELGQYSSPTQLIIFLNTLLAFGCVFGNLACLISMNFFSRSLARLNFYYNTSLVMTIMPFMALVWTFIVMGLDSHWPVLVATLIAGTLTWLIFFSFVKPLYPRRRTLLS